jgi:hypothetical protein
MASPLATSPQLQQVLRGSDSTRVSNVNRGADLNRGAELNRGADSNRSSELNRSELRTTVIILKKMQGSVWRETGRTTMCPTPEWLSASYGAGEYELRLKRGNRVVCMVGVAAS